MTVPASLRRAWPGALLLALAFIPLGPARAAEPGASRARTTASADLFGLLAPDGLSLTATLLRHWDLEEGDSPLLRGRSFEAGLSMSATPAYGQVGLFADWVPLAILELHLEYNGYGFFGRNQGLLRFPSARSPFGKAELDAAAGSEEAAVGHRLQIAPALRARVGPLLAQSQFTLAGYAIARSAGWFYDLEDDTLVANRDWVLSNRTGLLVELWRGSEEAMLLLGPAYEVTHARKAALTRQRAEGILFWSPADRLGALQRPRLTVMSGLNLEDRNRKGRWFGLVGVGADVDL